MCLNTWTPTTINFPFGTNGKLMFFKCSNAIALYGMSPDITFCSLHIADSTFFMKGLVKIWFGNFLAEQKMQLKLTWNL